MNRRTVLGFLLGGAFLLNVGTLLLRGSRGAALWGKSSFFAPTGLLLLALINIRLRSKLLAWGVFTVAFVLFMIVVGTWVVMDRAMRGPSPIDFFRTSVLYGFLAAAGLMQLRVSSPPKGVSTP